MNAEVSVDDALLLLLLAEKVHGTDSSIRRVANKFVPSLAATMRDLIPGHCTWSTAATPQPERHFPHPAMPTNDGALQGRRRLLQ